MVRGFVVSLILILYSCTSHGLSSAANTTKPTNYTSYSSAWSDAYEFRPPPPPIYNSPWLPPEDFYENFDPWIADIVRNRVHDILTVWRTRHLPPMYHCRYTCERYTPPRISPSAAHENPTPAQAHKNTTPPQVHENPTPPQAHENPTPPHDVQENPTLPPTPHDMKENPTLTPPVHENPTIPPPPRFSADDCPTIAKVMETCTRRRRHELVKSAYSSTCTYSDECCKETLNVHDECLNLNPTISWLKSICCDSSKIPAGDKADT